MGNPAAFRVPAGQFDDEVQSTGSNRRRPLHRMATSGHEELGREERMEPVDNLRIEIRLRSTACDVYSSAKVGALGARSIVAPPGTSRHRN